MGIQNANCVREEKIYTEKGRERKRKRETAEGRGARDKER